jgi:hypothetical protein
MPIEKLIGSSPRLCWGSHAVFALQRVDVELDVPSQWVTWRKIFILDEGAASRTINLDETNPFRIRREVEFCAGTYGLVYLTRVTIREDASQLVRFPCRPEIVAAAIAAPSLGLGINIEVFGDPHPHKFPPNTAPFSVLRRALAVCTQAFVFRRVEATGPCQLSKDHCRMSVVRTNDRLTVIE